MFEFLFNEPLAIWRQADWVFASGWSATALTAAIAAAAVLLAVSLLRVPVSPWRRTGVGLLQLTVAAAALLMLWQPALRVDVTQPGENSVAWVLDTSASMQRADSSGAPSRVALATRALADESLIDDGQFQASLYTLGESLTPVDSFDSVPAASARTAIGDGLETLLDTVKQQSLAAVVLLSDGGNNLGNIDSDWWNALRNAGVPVHTVGVGAETLPDDIELADVRLPAQVTPESPVAAHLRIVHGRGGTARVRVTDGDTLVYAGDVLLSDDTRETRHTLSFDSGGAGLRELEFSVAGDRVESELLNNQQPRVLQVVDAPRRILYVEGEPRWEYKFLRRALAGQTDLEVASLLRTSPNKFYRQGLRDPGELADGFPATREALFSYDAVIIGSLEAAELDATQQANLRDFVNIRGGSLLMLAGLSGLADGGWGRSVVAAALPVSLSARRVNQGYTRERSQVVLTEQGQRTEWLKLADDDAANRALWAELPELADHQSVGTPRAGAVVALARAEGSHDMPLLVWHRYGQGQSFVLGTGGTWRWQMRLPFEDQSHERFWQQLLRHLVSSALPRISIDTGVPVYRDANQATVEVTARYADYRPLDVPVLPVTVEQADGKRQTIELTAAIEQPGRYTGVVALAQTGPFAITATTPLEGESPSHVDMASIQRWAVNERDTAEAFGAAQDRTLLERIAETSGGAYHPLAAIGQLPEALQTINAALVREERLPLWNMPALFLLIMLAKTLEWLLRLRWKRL